MDEPGPGGANREYAITFHDPKHGGAERSPISDKHGRNCIISFQDGNPDVGINGISNEALLAIVEDRLEGFQGGRFACRETAVALTKIQEAMMWLQKRTRDRVARGVEGTQVVLVFLAVMLLSSMGFAQEPLDSYQSNSLRGGYERFGSATASWSTNPPRLYSGGTYLGELSANRYAPDSVSNPYGRFGSRYSPTSINNPYSRYGAYRTQPVWVYPKRR